MENKEVKIANVGDSVTAEFAGNDVGFKISANVPVSYQMMIASANSIYITALDGFVASLAEMEDQEEAELMKAFTYDQLNTQFSNLLEKVLPESLENDFSKEAEEAMKTEEVYIDLKFKATQYEKIVEKMAEYDKGYVKVSKDELGRLKF